MPMKRSNDNWERLVAAVLRKEQLWELFHARSPSVLSEASDVSSSFDMDNVAFDFSIPGSSSPYQQQRKSSITKSRNPGLIFMDGVWPDFGLEDLLCAPTVILGKGTSGSVYATRLNKRMTVVVKRLELFVVTEQDFKRRMEAVGDVRHPNVAPLWAYYTSVEEKLVLYDHHTSGSLSELLRLHCYEENGSYRPRLDWGARVKVALGAARGISHIHAQNGGKLVHGNLKASNIFLNSEGYGYVSDLGSANMTPTTFVAATAWLYAPEVKSTQKVSQASDVYSFGMLLFELLIPSLSGHEPVDLLKLVNSRSVHNKEKLFYMLDRNLSWNQKARGGMVSMLDIGLVCIEKSHERRPTMSEVVNMIENIYIMSSTDVFGINDYMDGVSVETKIRKLVFFGYRNHRYDMDGLFGDIVAMGIGTYGITYKAKLESGIIILVKTLRNIIVTDEQFQQHLEDIGRVRHQNVAELKAYFYSDRIKLMTYDYYNQGSVSTMLHGNGDSDRIRLDWKSRLKIALDAARGIAHIHTTNDGKLVHGNIRTSNIFLNEQQHAVVTHVGLASLMRPIRSILRDEGDLAPEFIDTKEATQASDVYSFGVVLLELISGMSPRCTKYNNNISVVRWIRSVPHEEWRAKVFDKELYRYGNVEEEVMVLVTQLAMDCVARVSKTRPRMVDILKRLVEINRSER